MGKKGVVNNPKGINGARKPARQLGVFITELLKKSEREVEATYKSLPPHEKLQAFIALAPYATLTETDNPQ